MFKEITTEWKNDQKVVDKNKYKIYVNICQIMQNQKPFAQQWYYK